MSRNPTYEELERRVKELGQEALEHTRAGKSAIEDIKKWERIFNVLPDHIAILAKNHKILRVNKAMADALGLTAQQAIGLTCYECVHGTNAPPAFCPHSKMLNDGLAHTAEFYEKQLSGWFLVSVNPLHEPEGRLMGGVHVARNITARKKAEEALREGEERYRQLVDNANDIIYRTTDDGRFTFLNPTAVRTMGYSEKELIGKHYLELIRPDYRKDAEGIYESQFVKKISNTYHEFPAITKDGKEIWLGQNVQLIMEEDSVTGFQAVARDITGRKLAEEALQGSEERYRDLYENAPNSYFSVSAIDGSILRCNSAALRLLGYDRKTIMRMKVWDLYADTPHGLSKAQQVFARFKAGESIRDEELQMKYKDGNPIWISLSVEPVRDRDGNITESRSMVIDISERKRLEAALIQKEKLNSLGAMAAEVAHEIRNPLVSIGGFARRLQKKFQGLPECDIILSESQRLERLLSRIINYLRPAEISPQQCSANTIINYCVDLLSPEMKKKQVLYRLDLAPRLSAVYIDSDILTQIFINLIRNAAEAMDKGGTLIIKTFEDDQNVHIEFKNQASPLKIKRSELLFLPFAEGGQSIGLPLCFRLLKDMGGLLSFAPENNYIVFIVSLPKSVHPGRREEKAKSEQGSIHFLL